MNKPQPTLQEKRLEFDFPKFTWIAQYEDGVELCEYEEDGTHHLFSEIDKNRLEFFVITDETGKERYSVNAKTGQFDLNGLKLWSFLLPRIEKDGKSVIDYSFIWFKRVRRDFKPDREICTMMYVIGLQTTHEGKNYKQLVWILEDGSVIINGEK